ncbi:MAG: helix-turn-helix transcriptional regulator [Bacteroidia bacterium]
MSTYTLTGSSDLMDAHIQNIFIRPDFTLNITKLKVKQAVELESPFPTHLVGFSFSLVGQSKFIIPVDNSQNDFKAGKASLFKTYPHNGFAQFLPQNEYISIAIHLSVEKFKEIIGDSVNDLPKDFADCISGKKEHHAYFYNYSSKSKLLIESIVSEELKGLSRQFFLESKVLELIGLQLEEIAKHSSETKLKSEDEKKIRDCERLLTANYNQPHSLIELAKSVGLNDFKLKQGFKSIYGKPVFKYLQEYRLNKAYEALNFGNKQVSEVAEEIGYRSIGSFSNAFLNQFGLRPNEVKSV